MLFTHVSADKQVRCLAACDVTIVVVDDLTGVFQPLALKHFLPSHRTARRKLPAPASLPALSGSHRGFPISEDIFLSRPTAASPSSFCATQ